MSPAPQPVVPIAPGDGATGITTAGASAKPTDMTSSMFSSRRSVIGMALRSPTNAPGISAAGKRMVMKAKMPPTLLVALATAAYITPSHAQTYYTSANLDFSSIDFVHHSSQFISDIAWFSIVGTAFGSRAGIHGIYLSQDQIVMQRCLALAEQFNLSRRISTSPPFPLLRIQVETDPANEQFARIQYCTIND